MDPLVRDLRFGLRMIKNSPGFTAVAIITLALGIGANTAIFSLLDAVLLRPLPYQNANRLTVIWQSDAKRQKTGAIFDTYREFEEWTRHSHSFEKLAALTWATAGGILVWQGKPQQVLAIPTSVDFFSLLGVHAAQGRTFASEDLKNPCTVVLSHGFWRDNLGGAPHLVGRSLIINKKACTVAGIMPKDFSFYPIQTQLWTLLTPDSAYAKHPWESEVGVFGLLKPGVSRASAQAELITLQKRMIGEAPPDLTALRMLPDVLDLQREFTWLAGRNLRTSLITVFVAAALVLLIACVNVANLLLGRASERQKELGIRAALGSGRSRLIRQLLTESMLLSVGGASFGIFIAIAGIRYFRAANAVQLPPGNPVTANWQVLAFTAFLAILTGLLFGLVPAWKVSRLDLNEALKESSRSISRGALSHRAGRVMVVAEVALSLALLVGAGLLIESVGRLNSTPLGFQPDHILTATIRLPSSAYPKPEQRIRFYSRLMLHMKSLPGVKGVALSPPMIGSGGYPLTVEGNPSAPNALAYSVSKESVGADYFRVMEIPLLQGRAFDTRDREKTLPVAIVNQALAEHCFPNKNPIGQEIKLGVPDENKPWLTIVGVVGNVKSTTVFKEMGYVVSPRVYRPYRQNAVSSVSIYFRTSLSPAALVPAIRRGVWDLDNNLPPPTVETMNQWLSQFFSQPRLRAILLGIFAGLALLLAAIGIYGVLSQSVVQRTHEIGIRMALGAQRRDVLKLVVAQGLTLALVGVGIGIVAALGLTRLMASLLYGVKPTDPLTFAGVALLLLAVAFLACYIPARRAAKVDPMEALRYE